MEEGARKRKIKFTKLSLTKSKSSSSAENLGKTSSTQISQFFRKHKSENVIPNEETEETNSPEPEIIEPKIRRSSRTVNKLPEPNPNKEITKFLSKKSIDDDDSAFQIPKKKKIFTPVKEDKKPIVRKSRARKQPDIRKTLKKNEENEVLDPEHLQMALALSRSLLDTQGLTETEAIVGVNNKRTLAEFGFKSKTSLNKDFNSLMGFDGKVPKWMKKCTKLTRRNPELQKKLMEEKVQIILNEEFLEHPYYERTARNYKATSNLLKNCYSKENKTFFKNSLEQESSIIFDQYYVGDLLEKSNTVAGCLLRDWSKIPGRDLSPENLDIHIEYIPTQKCPTQNSEPKSSEINNEKDEEEEDTYLFSEESESEVVVEASDKDDEKISSAKSECSQNNFKNIEMEKSLIEVINSPEEQMEVEVFSSESSGMIVRDVENSPEKMEVELEPAVTDSLECDKIPESIRVVSPDLFSDLESSSAESIVENEDQTIINPFESYLSKELPSFSQVANNIVIEDSSSSSSSSSAESLPEYNGIVHYENFESEEAKIGNNNSIIVLSDDEEDDPQPQLEKEILSLSSTDTISLNPIQSTCTAAQNPGLTKIFEESFLCSENEDENEKIDLTQDEDENIISPQSKIDQMVSKSDSLLSNGGEAEGDPDELIVSDEEVNFSMRKANKLDEKSILDDFDVLINGNQENIFEESVLEDSKEKSLLDESLTEILNKTDFDECSSMRKPNEFKRFRSETQFNRPDDFHYPDLLREDDYDIVEPEEPEDDLQISSNKIIEFLSKTFEMEFEHETDLYTIKTKNFQIKPNYKIMSLFSLTEELKNFGIKKLSKNRSIFILEHIYRQTHPVFNENNGNLFIEEEEIKTKIKSPKRKKKISSSQPTSSKYLDLENIIIESNNSQKTEISPEDDFSVNFLVDDGTCAEIENEEYFLPSKSRGKINLCAVPLHIAFYNKIKSDKKMKELILCYEPINLDKLYEFFKGIGLRYEPNDLISFLDSRCITFRTFKNGRNKHNSQEEL